MPLIGLRLHARHKQEREELASNLHTNMHRGNTGANNEMKKNLTAVFLVMVKKSK